MTEQATGTNDTQSQQASRNAPSACRPDAPAQRVRRQAAPDGSECSNSPWYSPHTGTKLQERLELNHFQRDRKTAKIYPSGVKIEGFKNLFAEDRKPVGVVATQDTKRGEIEGFSHEAARRLRGWFMTQKVDGSNLWAITLTTHANLSPDQWRAVMMRFRIYLKRKGWAGVWRVELQKRRAPHAHVAFWLPVGVDLAAVVALWLECTGETNDPAAREHAVEGREIPADETGWAVYMGLHDGKHKEAQLGWKGKQWGIWNREAFSEREAVELELSAREHALFLRILRNWDVADRMRRERDAEERADAETVARIRAANGGRLPKCFKVVASPVRRPAPRYLHRGNLLRLLDGAFVEFVIAAIMAGRVGTSAPVPVARITSAMLSTFSTSAA